MQLSKDDIVMMIEEAARRRQGKTGGGGESVDMATFLGILNNCPWY